jgi:hypothetical protein
MKTCIRKPINDKGSNVMKIQTKETAMKPATPKTEQQPPTLLRKAVFGGVLSFRWGLLFTALASILPNVIFADEIYLTDLVLGSDPFWRQSLTNNSGSLSMSHVGNWSSLSASVAFGSVQLNLKAAASSTGAGYATCHGHWTDTITINSDDPALLGSSGTVQLIFHLSGSQVVGIIASGTANEYTIVFDGDFGYGGYNGNYTGGYMGCYPNCFSGTHIADLATFTHSKGIIFGAPFPFECELSGGVTPSSGGDSTSLQASLLSGTMTVLDGSGNPVSYRATSSVGSSRGAAFTTGGSYSGFSLANTVGYQTQLALLGGNASSNEMVTASFVANPMTNAFASDAVDFSGTISDKFVLQLSYDPTAENGVFLGPSGLLRASGLILEWLNPASNTWENVVLGNSDGGAQQQHILGAYNAGVDFVLGDYGVDTTNHTVWAVIDHNSVFAVGEVQVVPSTAFQSFSLTNGNFQFSFAGPTGSSCLIEASTNLFNWAPLLTNTPFNGLLNYVDPQTPQFPIHFYRATIYP